MRLTMTIHWTRMMTVLWVSRLMLQTGALTVVAAHMCSLVVEPPGVRLIVPMVDFGLDANHSAAT